MRCRKTRTRGSTRPSRRRSVPCPFARVCPTLFVPLTAAAASPPLARGRTGVADHQQVPRGSPKCVLARARACARRCAACSWQRSVGRSALVRHGRRVCAWPVLLSCTLHHRARRRRTDPKLNATCCSTSHHVATCCNTSHRVAT
jgi:hypothetical protein